MKKQLIVGFIFLICAQQAFGTDSLYVKLNKTTFAKGDTLSVDCLMKYSNRDMAAVTLNVWIEDIQKTRTWKFRYPILNGRTAFDIAIHDSLPDGKYAVNFLVQPTFFYIKGKVRDYNKKSKGLLMCMLSKTKSSYFNTIVPDNAGNFKVGRLAFADTARFIFSEIGKKRSDLYIDIETPIDSAFSPVLQYTELITVGNPKLIAADTIKPYSLDAKKFTGVFTLDEVVVKSTKKKNVEKFDDEYASGLFKGGTIFDGLDNPELESALDVFTFLNGRVPGLQVLPDGEGGYNIKRRGSTVDIYLDEFRMEPENPIYVNPADVAMIKVFGPMEGPGRAGGGSIAIYTKRGNYVQNSSRRNNFAIRGFTAIDTVWK